MAFKLLRNIVGQRSGKSAAKRHFGARYRKLSIAKFFNTELRHNRMKFPSISFPGGGARWQLDPDHSFRIGIFLERILQPHGLNQALPTYLSLAWAQQRARGALLRPYH